VTAPARPARRWLAALAALALLNFALTFDNLWPTLWIRPRWALSVELAAAVLFLAAAIERRGPPSQRALAALGAAIVLLAAGRYVEVTAREMYGRPINLYYDVPHLPRVVAMFAEAAPGWVAAASAAGVVLGAALAVVLARWAVTRVADALALRAVRRTGAVCAGAACVAFALGAGGFTPPVTASYARQAALLMSALGGGGRALGDSPDFGAGLARLAGADVFVVFVESYGAATYDRPVLRERLGADRAALARAAEETGRSVVSALVESPTFGGASWLAHASLLTGVEVRDGDAYNLLTLQRRPSLVGAFAKAGHRTVALMPGLRQDWREGAALYGFDAIYDAARLDYRGPAFGWWRIPDQYALARLDRDEVASRERAPLFVFFPTITSHAPFRPLPPYQPDWDRLLSDAPFDPATLPPRVPPADEWRNLDPAYGDAIGYALATLAGYLRERHASPLVLIVLGDHQPPAGVAGEHASWAVPVHVIAPRGAVIDALVAAGFVAGVEPRRPALGRMHELTPILLRAFGSGEPGIDVAGPVARPQATEERPDRVGI
jgi:phosphoglycerol transferase MdoB-like AlkP superfamily enzyme